MEKLHDKKKIIAALTDSRHGDLKAYLGVGTDAAQADPDFYGHLVSWNAAKGSIRDTQVALPVIALKALHYVQSPTEWSAASVVFAENALACIANLGPREFKRAIEFGWDIGAPTRLMKRLMIRKLRDLEADRHGWERTALRHRDTLRWMYSQAQIPVRAHGGESALYDRYRQVKKHGLPLIDDRGLAPARFRVFGDLKNMSPVEIAGMIDRYKLPFLNVRDALGKKAQEPDVTMALMKRMSTTELVSNMKWLVRCGVKTVPALRATLEELLGTAATPKKAKRQKSGVLKTTKAAEVLAGDEVLAGKLHVLQERQIEQVGSIDGNWLVLADMSGSMESAMEVAKLVSSTLARLVSGQVHLVFFNVTPRYFNVTGKSYEDIKAITATMVAGGGTSIGCGVRDIADRNITVDGIAIVSDGCENEMAGAPFGSEYTRYAKLIDATPTVYWYRTAVKVSDDIVQQYMRQRSLSRAEVIEAIRLNARNELDLFQRRCRQAGVDLSETTYDLSATADYHSVLNLVPTMRASRYALLDEILSAPFRTLDHVLDKTRGEAVLPILQPVHA